VSVVHSRQSRLLDRWKDCCRGGLIDESTSSKGGEGGECEDARVAICRRVRPRASQVG
jgi:hypothetical protein